MVFSSAPVSQLFGVSDIFGSESAATDGSKCALAITMTGMSGGGSGSAGGGGSMATLGSECLCEVTEEY